MTAPAAMHNAAPTSAPAAMNAPAPRLGAYAAFGGLLAMAGLPIYLHAPKFYLDEYGVSLAALGGVLFLLRLVDVVQDPALGWLAEALRPARARAVSLALVVMAGAMLGLFALTPPIAPLLWFALMLLALFSAYSFLTISFYAQGVAKAAGLGRGGHLRLAAWRETGALIGVCLAALAPTALAGSGAPYAGFALGFAGIALIAGSLMAPEWRASGPAAPTGGWRPLLRDPITRRLLILALINATPLAVSSTLFLFFVESRLEAPGWEGPLLLLFFAAAAASAPLWGALARRFGPKRVLLAAMGLAVITFAFTARLGPGDTLAFALICLSSGAALGADLTLLPAIFAARLARVAPQGGQGFGLWAFVSKASLAFAAVTLLPLLEAAGFQSGAASPPEALRLLSLLYALVPCALKLIAIALLAATPLGDET